jgi:diguanylate cyclase (GGDEF)-like protein/PAS domain S-box-containing protein
MSLRLVSVALLVRDYDEAIAWFVDVLGFELREDSPRGNGKRWVVVGPPADAGATVLLARAATAEQLAQVGQQAGGRVGLFLETSDFAGTHAAMAGRGVRFLEAPRHEAYGTVAVFADLYGNRWDLLQMHAATADRERAARQRHESDHRLRDLLANVQMVAMTLDEQARITYCNDYLLRLTGWSREELIGQDWAARFAPHGAAPQSTIDALLAGRPEALQYESEILTRAGERRLIRWNNTVLRSDAGVAIGTASIGEDITEQQRAQAKVRRLNRVYAVLSGINMLLVHATDRTALFAEACRIAVDLGLFKVAIIAMVDATTEHVVPVAIAGAGQDFLAVLRPRLGLRPDGSDEIGVAATAVLSRRPVVVDPLRGDGRVRSEVEMIALGIESLAVLPLLIGDRAVGALGLFAGEAGFFDDEEMALLTELTVNIAFAIDHIEKGERLNYLAYYDVLTGLANRDLFLERVAQFSRTAAAGGHKLAVVMFDLERFRNINESLGQTAGDGLLRQIAEWMVDEWSDGNLLARVDADHFALVVPKVAHEGDVARLLERTMDSLASHLFKLDTAELRIAAKAGVALFPDDGTTADALFKRAEAALKKAKDSGERYLFYTEKMTGAVAGKLMLETQLRHALDNEEFVLHYQPKVQLATGKVVGAEALIRWNDPRTGLVPPGKFIPILEETGLISAVGRWALRQALADYLRWRGDGLPAMRVAVNVSALQLRNRGFIAEVAQVLAVHADAPRGLELEITESMIMDDVRQSITSLQAIREMGVTIAIDDFGTGFSSLGYLAKLPVDTLKVDRSFVVEMNVNPEGMSLVSTIISLAHSLQLKVVAEGVETEEQQRMLKLLKCDQMQGYLFCKPIPAEDFEARFLRPPVVQ